MSPGRGKYLKEGKLPSERKGIRDWRTRPLTSQGYYRRPAGYVSAERDAIGKPRR
ncbi:hypothetical protein DesfrDRAFT_2383 [Solidesulfovibrio fructosivorans JJ]]|uniref:Uncharacterized protein n=1 Tax=Solidesulfovibrio fructosivorans JJ] TaxID=596151 RepID=E1JXN4_SOLFR|nr:hypothetical protein DesfrDRAFT_2383 [Solidesulfovibrio fructosivorans JJ]]